MNLRRLDAATVAVALDETTEPGDVVRLWGAFAEPGRAVPDHGHGGLELTLVLQGSFHDASGAFKAGDVEVATEDVQHVPIAGEGMACICLAASDAPLRFRGWLPRLLQPMFRI